MKSFSLVLAVLVISVGGCSPKVAGFFGEKPVDRATFERQAAERRGALEIERATLTAELAAAEALGDAKGIAKVKADMAVHEAASKTYNELYGQGIDDLDRQAEANEQVFTTLTAAGELGASAVGLPPGVSQLIIGALLGVAGRAGWIRMRRGKAAAAPSNPPPPNPPAASGSPVVQT